MKILRPALCAIAVTGIYCVSLCAQGPPNQQQPKLIRQGRSLMRQGRLEDALALYRKALEATPDSLPANHAAGVVLDLMGQGAEARKHFEAALRAAGSPGQRAAEKRALAMSYAFAGDCKKASAYERQVFDYFGSNGDFYQQGEVADEAGRVCLDSGDLDAAYTWYKLGHGAGLEEPGIQPSRVDLWNFRWEHAQARIAARRGEFAEALRHVAAAKAILAKGTNPQQEQFFPYLEGYVAFYRGDYQAALADFEHANEKDPFIQCLMAQTYEKLGDPGKATEFYRLARSSIAHNPAGAYAVPLARKKLRGS